ncbi:actinia tenebrosa protease inhibitors-like [Ixodes scapularis]
MQPGALFFLVVAAFGFRYCEPAGVADITYDEYSEEDDNQSVCSSEPESGRGRAYVKGWAYYKKLDKCYVFYFGDNIFSGNENKFMSEAECNAVCRANVPRKCYKSSPTSTGNEDCSTTTYNPMFGSCKMTCADIQKDKDENVFNNFEHCESECLAEDFRLCLNPTAKKCDATFYVYNSQTQTCEKTSDGYCRGFESSKDCYKRCGVLVDQKCKLPIQNIGVCEEPSTRYAYNKLSDKCEEFLGCDDGGNSFGTAKECWRLCASPLNRCFLHPDTGKFVNVGWYARYYYDIQVNECKEAKKARKTIPGDRNLFLTSEDCEKHCKPKHEENHAI